MIPYAKQSINEDDIESVIRVLRSKFLTQGPRVAELEEAVAERVGARYAVAVNSATSALHIGNLALGLAPGDELWTVPNTFVASANAGLHCGARVDFVDIDPLTWNMSVSSLRAKLLEARSGERLPKVVVPVHFAGQASEQEAIWELSREFGFRLLEDASHSLGGSRSGEPIGSCAWSDIAVFSFHAVKMITAGEGGMALTNSLTLADRMRMLRTHGVTRDPERFLSVPGTGEDPPVPPPWYYEQQLLGFNYRMTDIQAGLCTSQLNRLDYFVERRNTLARFYDDRLSSLPLQLPTVLPENLSAFHLYVVRLTDSSGPQVHRDVLAHLRRRGVEANVHYMPVHLQPYYRELGFGVGSFCEAEAHGNSAITLPLYPDLTQREQEEVALALEEAL